MNERDKCPYCEQSVSWRNGTFQRHLDSSDCGVYARAFRTEEIATLCFVRTCPVRTKHESGFCQYHGKRGPFAEVHAQRSHMERL